MLKKFKEYCKLLRIKHWIKNIIVAIPAFFGGVILKKDIIVSIILGFLVFSICSSIVYVLNDLCDIEKDRQHPVKCKRPLASGAVSKKEGCMLLAVLTPLALAIDFYLNGLHFGFFIPVLYLALNILYSFFLKQKPVIDLVILVSGFVLRMFYGSCITDVVISNWLYLTLISLSFFLAFGKRRNEKESCGSATRTVLDSYSERYLNSSMYMYLSLFLVFYALWSMDVNTLDGMIYTTPLVIVMVMRYTYTLEHDKHGNPTDMIFSDKVLIVLCGIYAVFVFILRYFPEVVHEYLRF